MCIHPTKAGAQCKKNPELDLCGTHLVNLSVTELSDSQNLLLATRVDSKLIQDVEKFVLAPVLHRIFAVVNDGDLVLASNFYRQPAKAHQIPCGNCRKNGVENPVHPSISSVRECYKARYAQS